MTLYLYISNDEYELPLAVADSPAELGRMIGLDRKSVSKAIYLAKKRGSKSRYLKIEVGSIREEELCKKNTKSTQSIAAT